MRQNLITVWGVYEKEIERFHPRQRRHPWNLSAVSLRFGDVGPEDRHPDIRMDTQDGRAAFTAKVYATQNSSELHNLTYSTQDQGNRKVHVIEKVTEGIASSTIVFEELGGTMAWTVLSTWCRFVLSAIQYAHLMAHLGLRFELYGVAHLEDLLELVDLPIGARKAFLRRAKEFDAIDVQEASTPPPLAEASSQGGPLERPPNYWIRKELEEFNALGVRSSLPTDNMAFQTRCPIQAPDLAGGMHPIFRVEFFGHLLWQERLERLRQTFVLASRLLEVATPWFASLLPHAACGATNINNSNTAIVHVPAVQHPTRQGLEVVRGGLRALVGHVTWNANPHLLSAKKVWSDWQRATLTGAASRPIPLSVNEHASLDQGDREKGNKLRNIHVMIAEQLVQAACEARPDTEEHLFATFFLAVVLVSELGRAAWLTNLDNLPHTNVRFGNDVRVDLGNSLIGWIFGGWYPKPNHLGKFGDQKDLAYYHVRHGLHWHKLHQRSLRRPLYETVYSMPIHYIQGTLSQRRWARVDNALQPLQVARRILKPVTPFQQRHTARVAQEILVDPNLDWGSPTVQVKFYEDLDWEVTPPPEWASEDLRAARALGHDVSPLDLTGDIHPIFAFENWTEAPDNLEDPRAGRKQSLMNLHYRKLRLV